MAAVTENKNSNVADVFQPGVEIVQFTTSASGDTYDCKRIKIVQGAFASQETTDGEEIQISSANQSNGQPRITITLESGSAVTGYLTIFGRL